MWGLRSCILQSSDIKSVADWYSQVFQKAPYFEAECYIGFDVEGFELGIFYRPETDIQMGNNVEIYWGVDDVEWELVRLIELWATKKDDPVDVGEGIIMATAIDPFGNILGIIYNPNFRA